MLLIRVPHDLGDPKTGPPFRELLIWRTHLKTTAASGQKELEKDSSTKGQRRESLHAKTSDSVGIRWVLDLRFRVSSGCRVT